MYLSVSCGQDEPCEKAVTLVSARTNRPNKDFLIGLIMRVILGETILLIDKLTHKAGKFTDYYNRKTKAADMKERIIVTGASRGIGRALVEELKMRGEEVISISRGEGPQCTYEDDEWKVMFDWQSYNQLIPLFKSVFDEGLRVKGVVNNAGVLKKASLLDVGLSEFEEHNRVNVWNPLMLFKALYREGYFTSDAHIVNIGSMGGIQGASKFPGLFSYGGSKSLLAALTESLDAEFGAEGLSFNYLALGAVNTEMLKEAFPGYFSQVTPENMAKFIASFLLESGSLMSGKLIQVAKSDPDT